MADTPLSSKASATPGATAKVVFIDGSNNVRLSTKADLQAHVVGGVPTAAGTAVLTAADAAAQRTALGLGTAATTAAADYATAAQGVTNGNSHDHSGGDGAQIAYSSLSGLPTLPTGTNTGDQTIANTSDATSHTVTLSGSGGSVQFVEGANITLTTTGTSGAGVVTIASTASGSGTVTSASVVSANGFAGTVDNATTTPAITLTTSITGLLKGNGTAISAATAATDYAAAGAVGSTGITMSTARLLGRSTASTGAVEEITLGTNLSFSGTTLNATGGSGGGDVSAVSSPTSGQAAEWTSGTAIQGVAVTGTGSYVKADSPTLVTPALGTPSALVLTHATGLPNAAVIGLGTAATTAATAYATAAQGAKADTAVQPGALATVATTGAYSDLTGKPTLGTAAAEASTAFATSAQGAKADSALQTVAAATISDGTAAGRALLTAADVAAQRTALSIGNVDNTSDANKPVSTATQTALNAKADLSGGKLAASQIPDLSVVTYLGSVASQSEMLALTGQSGDWCIRTDLATTWIITGADPTLLAGWTQLSYPTAPVTSVAGRTGAVTLSSSDISGLGALATVAPGTGVATALAINVGSAGAPVLLGGAGGTPSSLTLTNATGLPAAGIADSTSAGRALLTAVDAAAQRTALGLGAAALVGVDAVPTNGSANAAGSDGVFDALAAKQDSLVSGTNIKTINGTTLLGAGNLSTFGVPLANLTTDYGVRKIRAALRQMRAGDILPAPVPVAAYKYSGTAVYCNPAVGGPGTGTLNDPYQSIVTALAAITTAGQGLFVLSGSTVNITAALSVPVSGTASAPIVIGVYYAGGRICTGRLGAVTIDCGANAIDAFVVPSRNYVCIEGFKIQNNGSANNGILLSGTSANCQVLNNDLVAGSVGIHMNMSGAGNVVQGNRSAGSATGIYVHPTTTDSTTTVQYNVVTGATSRSLQIYGDYDNARKFSGTIAYNVLRDSPSLASDGSGIEIVMAGGAPKIYGNVISKCNVGISVVSCIDFVAKHADYSGMLIQNNDIRNCEFGAATNGVIGTWLMEHNYIADSGTWNGTTKITTAGYGRGIELFGASVGMASGGGTIRFNFITRARNWATGTDANGGEGIGIGLDDNTFGVTVYGNFCVQNEGSGIQLNTANGNKIVSNICYDNCALPGGSPRVIINGLACEITAALSFDTLIANNTLISTGRTYQRNGISTWIYDGPGSRVHNNLCIGQTVAGMSMTAGYTESHNRVVGAPSLVVTETEAARTAGTGTASTTSAAALVPDDLFFSILPGGSCDGTGVDLGEALVDFDGQLSGGARNIGATLLLSETR